MSNAKKQRMIGAFLDDLTHLEIDTIITTGMVAGAPPQSSEEMISAIFERYRRKIAILLESNDLDFDFKPSECESFRKLESDILELRTFMDADLETRGMTDDDFTLILRMQKFIGFIKKLEQQKATVLSGSSINLFDYEKIAQPETYTIADMNTDVRIKLKYYYDLGTEKVVMQTRFGLDGDVVTRIDRKFANEPKQVLIDLHERHLNISTGYWKFLVEVGVDLLGKIWDKMKI